MSRLFAVILKCFKLLDMSYLPMQNLAKMLPNISSLLICPVISPR